MFMCDSSFSASWAGAPTERTARHAPEKYFFDHSQAEEVLAEVAEVVAAEVEEVEEVAEAEVNLDFAPLVLLPNRSV